MEVSSTATIKIDQTSKDLVVEGEEKTPKACLQDMGYSMVRITGSEQAAGSRSLKRLQRDESDEKVMRK